VLASHARPLAQLPPGQRESVCVRVRERESVRERVCV